MDISLARLLALTIVRIIVLILWWIDYATSTLRSFLKALILLLAVVLVSASFKQVLYIKSLSELRSLSLAITSPVTYDVIENDHIMAMQQLLSENPKLVKEVQMPLISARSAYVYDLKNNKVLYSLNEHIKSAPASTTKLMTALVSLDLYSLSETVEMPLHCTSVDSTKAGYLAEIKIPVSELIQTLLVGSSGDSACALSTGKVSYSEFISLMNKYAKEFSMYDSNFTNPIGLDDTDGSHYSTAVDLAILADHSISNEFISQTIQLKEITVNLGLPELDQEILNTNRLLWEIPQTRGVKTGTTLGAGEVLIYEYVEDQKDILIVVMGSSDRFTDTKSLLSWVLESYIWR